MKLLLSAFVALCLLGCTSSSKENPESSPNESSEKTVSATASTKSPVAASPVAASPVAASSDAKTVEVACATCIYKMSGVSGCKLAAKIDGKSVLVTGGSVNAHKDGLCSGAKQATVKGALKDGVFVATEVTLN